MADKQPKKYMTREEEFVEDMLKRAAEKEEPTQPNQIKEDPEEIQKIIKELKKKQQEQ